MTVRPVDPDIDSFRFALGAFASSVTVLSLWDGDRAVGMTATAFSSVCADPMLVLVCVNRSTRTFTRIESAGAFGVNILGAVAREVAEHCARPGQDKYLEPGWLTSGADWRSPALAGAVAFLDCDVDQVVEAGTHAILLGAVRGIGLSDAEHDDPLVYFRSGYRQLHTPRNLPYLGPLPIVLEESR